MRGRTGSAQCASQAAEHARHPGLVRAVPDERPAPVGVDQQQPSARPQHPEQLAQRRVHLGDVLEHLRAHGGIERPVLELEHPQVALDELCPGEVGTARPGHAHERLARVEPDYPPLRPHRLRQRAGEEPGPASCIQHPLARPGIEQAQGCLPLRHDIRGPVDRLDPPRRFFTEPWRPAHRLFPRCRPAGETQPRWPAPGSVDMAGTSG